MARSPEHQSPQFAVGAQFNSFADLKHSCIRAALLDVYEFTPVQVDSERYILKCKSKEHSLRLRASPIAGSSVWHIQTSIQTHTCHGINHLGHANLDEEFISIEILPKLCSDSSYMPKAIQNHIKDQFGVGISYQKAYQVKEHTL